MWIVLTSSAHMPTRCRGRYRNIALVEIDQKYTAENLRPKMISEHAKGVLQVRRWGHFSVGRTDRCAYAVNLKRAEEAAQALNNAAPIERPELITTFGGSA